MWSDMDESIIFRRIVWQGGQDERKKGLIGRVDARCKLATIESSGNKTVSHGF